MDYKTEWWFKTIRLFIFQGIFSILAFISIGIYAITNGLVWICMGALYVVAMIIMMIHSEISSRKDKKKFLLGEKL